MTQCINIEIPCIALPLSLAQFFLLGISGLKDNFFLASLQDAMVAAAPSCDSCESRGDHRPATTHCRDCVENLCEECLHAHQRLTLTKNHVLDSTAMIVRAEPQPRQV